MIYHAVLFKIKDGVSSDKVDDMIDALNKLGGKITELKFISVNHNFSSRSKGFSVVLMSAFDDKAALESYQQHPEHVSVVEKFVRPILDELVVGDIDTK